MEIPTKDETNIKIQIYKKCFDKYSKDIKFKLAFGPPMVLMCMLMSEVPNLKICNDDELSIIQNQMIHYAKNSIEQSIGISKQ